jgi:hypothetical protein
MNIGNIEYKIHRIIKRLKINLFSLSHFASLTLLRGSNYAKSQSSRKAKKINDGLLLITDNYLKYFESNKQTTEEII